MTQIPYPLLSGEVTVKGHDGGDIAFFDFETAAGTVRLAVKIAELGNIATAIARASNPGLPSPISPPTHVLPTTGWSIIGAGKQGVAFSFELGNVGSLSFLTPLGNGDAQIESLQAALGKTSSQPPPDPKSRN